MRKMIKSFFCKWLFWIIRVQKMSEIHFSGYENTRVDKEKKYIMVFLVEKKQDQGETKERPRRDQGEE